MHARHYSNFNKWAVIVHEKIEIRRNKEQEEAEASQSAVLFIGIGRVSISFPSLHLPTSIGALGSDYKITEQTARD